MIFKYTLKNISSSVFCILMYVACYCNLSKRVNFFDKLWARNKQTSNERPTVHAQSTGTHSSPHGWAQQAKLAN